MHKKVKDSINEIIGSEKIFSHEKQKETLAKINQSSQNKRGFNFSKLTPVFGFVTVLLLGIMLFSIFEKNLGEDLADKEELVEFANESIQVVTEEEANVREAVSRLEEKTTQLETEYDNLRQKLELLSHQSEDKSEEEAKSALNNKIDMLEDQEQKEEIIQDLLDPPEIIPLDGNEKLNPERIYLLSNKRVYVELDDGYLILKYTVENGKIYWEIIDTYTEKN